MERRRKADGEIVYTVIRFTGSGDKLPALEMVGISMNEKRPGVYEGIRAARDGFACGLSIAPEWEGHKRAVLCFLEEFSDQIIEARRAGVSLTVDVAVEPEDLKPCPQVRVLRGDPDFLASLSAKGVAIEISIYLFADAATSREEEENLVQHP